MRHSRKGKKHSALWRRVILVICGIVLGVNVYLFNATRLLGNSMPMPFGFGMAVVLSGSMEPAMSVGDLIIVREIREAQTSENAEAQMAEFGEQTVTSQDDRTAEFQVGDAIVFQSNGDMIVHRVIMMNNECLVTQGDANTVPDEPIAYDAVKGKVIACIPWVGNVVQFLRTPIGIILMLAAAFGLVELSYRRERSRDDDELEEIKKEIRKLRGEEILSDSKY